MKSSEKYFTQKIADLASSLTQQIELADENFHMTPEARKSRVLQVQNDFSFFRKTYFPHYIKNFYPCLHTVKQNVVQKTQENTSSAIIKNKLPDTIPILHFKTPAKGAETLKNYPIEKNLSTAKKIHTKYAWSRPQKIIPDLQTCHVPSYQNQQVYQEGIRQQADNFHFKNQKEKEDPHTYQNQQAYQEGQQSFREDAALHTWQEHAKLHTYQNQQAYQEGQQSFREDYLYQNQQQKQTDLHTYQNQQAYQEGQQSFREDAELHTWLDVALPQAIMDPAGQRLAIAAPRGEAKSTIVSLCFILWSIITERKKYILLIADTTAQAQTLLEAIKHELTTNPWLCNDFPEHTGEGRLWNVGTILTNSHVKIQALGAGKRMRGLRHGPYRPDLVILDDLENDQDVKKPEQRDKLQSWIQKTVLNLGPADGSMDIIYIGTILHYDSVLARIMVKPLWKSHIFRAIIQWPQQMDLWDQWETLLLEQGVEKAYTFWKHHQAAMCEGAIISWPKMRTLLQLMTIRTENHDAFDAEYQNDPLQGENAPFAECIHYWSIPSDTWIYFGTCDPSLGKHGAGRDPSAILVGGFCQKTMTLHVIEASIKKRHPDRIIEDIITFHQKYTPLLWGIEAVQFQEFFAHILVQRAEERGIPLPVKPLINNTDKILRIESLQPHMTHKHILLQPAQHELIQQLRHFPKADHDDGPDALEMLWRITTSGYISIKDAILTVSKISSQEDKEDTWI